MKNIAIFASGSGTNAQRIAEYFSDDADVSVKLILSNNPNAPVLERAKKLGIPTAVFTRTDFTDTTQVLEILLDNEIDLIVLAGFLWLMPKNLVMAFPDAIVNVHPALLPKFGGKGMYGMNVHNAVIAAGEKESGITIHKVDECYDEGATIAQFKCPIEANDTAESLAKKLQELEHEHFPRIIKEYLQKV